MSHDDANALSILRLIAASGGFYPGGFADPAGTNHCVDRGWIIAEDLQGYALTVDGSARLRDAPPPKAAEYRALADEMVRCANRAGTDDERLEYMKLAKAWLTLAGGEEQGLNTDRPCAETGEA